MNKILLVIKREYLTRVRKKTFIIMTIAAPLLLVAFYSVAFYFAINKDIGDNEKQIYISDKSGLFTGKLASKKNIEFVYGHGEDIPNQKVFLEDGGYYALLTIPASLNKDSIRMVAVDQPGIHMVSYIESQMEEVIKANKLAEIGINENVIRDINNIQVKVSTAKATETGSESSSALVNTAIGFGGAILIYLFIFLYGVQIMNGVIEEKTNRIVEIIISSLKPFQLMLGKIIGIALVALTQFLIWIVLVVFLGGGLSGALSMQMLSSPEASQIAADTAAGNGSEFIEALMSLDYVFIISMFLFYFISGYLFYGALFAAIGSAVDNETDRQQFMFPVTMPLVFAFIMAQTVVVANPNGQMAFWLSIIPFTSPVAMMVRVPFGIPVWEIVLSVVIMISGFIFTTWIAGRIYRIGILMYGKKPSYREIGKWLFYKG